MRVTRVQFQNKRGETLVGMLHGAPTDRAVISCHGMFSSKDGPKHVALAQALEAYEVPTLRFDFAGNGESGGSLYNLSYSHCMEDLDGAITYLAAQGVSRVGLFGSSMGGAVAYLGAARDERIVAVATLAAVANLRELVLRRYPTIPEYLASHPYFEVPEGRIGRQFWEDSCAHDVVAAVGILRAPILVIHGEDDTVVPCSDAHDIATAARQARLELVCGADHEFTNAAQLRPVVRDVAGFLADALK